MSKCIDCLHYEACKGTYCTAKGCDNIALYDFDGEMYADSGCEDFADRSEWLHLPCKVGDKVYIVKSRTSDDKNLYIIEDVVKRIVFDKSEDTGFIHSRIEFFNTSSISDWLFQNIFLTREEAEKALERMKENDN